MELRALKHGHAWRYLKAYLDVEGLVPVSKLDLRRPKIRELFPQYGTLDCMKTYAEQPTRNNWDLKDQPAASKLGLQVDPGYIPAVPRIELRAMLRRIQEIWRGAGPGPVNASTAWQLKWVLNSCFEGKQD